jgi:hypothetical protein
MSSSGAHEATRCQQQIDTTRTCTRSRHYVGLAAVPQVCAGRTWMLLAGALQPRHLTHRHLPSTTAGRHWHLAHPLWTATVLGCICKRRNTLPHLVHVRRHGRPVDAARQLSEVIALLATIAAAAAAAPPPRPAREDRAAYSKVAHAVFKRVVTGISVVAAVCC